MVVSALDAFQRDLRVGQRVTSSRRATGDPQPSFGDALMRRGRRDEGGRCSSGALAPPRAPARPHPLAEAQAMIDRANAATVNDAKVARVEIKTESARA